MDGGGCGFLARTQSGRERAGYLPATYRYARKQSSRNHEGENVAVVFLCSFFVRVHVCSSLYVSVHS